MSRASVLQQGENGLLRRPRPRDRDEFLRLVRASRPLHRPWVYPPDDETRFQAYPERNRSSEFEFMLVSRIFDGVLVGVYNLSQIFRGTFQNAYLGYYGFSPGEGYMSRLDVGLHAVKPQAGEGMAKAKPHPLTNIDSIQLVKQWGFRREGFSLRYLKVGGGWRDHERWAILADEWRSPRKLRSDQSASSLSSLFAPATR